MEFETTVSHTSGGVSSAVGNVEVKLWGVMGCGENVDLRKCIRLAVESVDGEDR